MTDLLPVWIADRISVQPDGCWHWTRTITEDGYGRAERIKGSPAKMAHRAVYLTLVGPIPEGLHLGHTCHDRETSCPGGSSCLHRRCVNPDHLQPMTHQENARAGRHAGRAQTHCKRGHEFTPENTAIYNGSRSCRQCHLLANRRFRATLEDPAAYYRDPRNRKRATAQRIQQEKG